MVNSDATALRLKMDATKFRPLFKTKPYLHLLAILFNWAIILFTIYLSLKFPSAGLYLLAIIIIGARMHAFAILTHDAAHFRFLKNRKWNDLISNYLTTYPIFSSLEKYRISHLKHHRNLNTDDDPDWLAKQHKHEFQFPKTRAQFLRNVCSYFLFYKGILDALWFLKRFDSHDERDVAKMGSKANKIGYYALLVVSLSVFGLWKYFLLYWMVPYFTTFFMFQYIRSVAEHFGELKYEDDLSSSRTVKASLIERFLIAPHHVNFHLEHHLYPGVPFYHLPKLHNLLMQQPDYNSKAHITCGYLGLLKELGDSRLARD